MANGASSAATGTSNGRGAPNAQPRDCARQRWNLTQDRQFEGRRMPVRRGVELDHLMDGRARRNARHQHRDKRREGRHDDRRSGDARTAPQAPRDQPERETGHRYQRRPGGGEAGDAAQ